MKKILLFVSALAGVLFAGSCQREELAPAGENGVVTFEVSIPEVATKAVVDDGSEINKLVYDVYWTDASVETAPAPDQLTLLYKGTKEVVNHATTIQVELMNDKNYVILFWAQRGNTWGVETDGTLLKDGVNFPDTFAANAENIEAFAGVSFLSSNNLSAKKSITLKRPFAQINLGSKLADNFTIVPTTSSMTVRNAGASFDLIKQVPVGNKTVEFSAAGVPGGKIKGDYTYVGMNYIFANGNVEVDYTLNTEAEMTVTNTVSNVPVAVNYRTNIIGKLFTSQADYTVTLEEQWAGDEEIIDVITDGLVKVQSTGEYKISTANGLAYASQNLFAKGGSFVLTEDIDMSEYTASQTKAGGKVWESVEISHKTFSFDGKGHTIRNLPGMFVRYTIWGDLTIKNLTLANPKIAYDVEDKSDKGVGAFFGFCDAFNQILLENCHVKGGEIAGGHWTGGLIGFAAGHNAEGVLTINNCSVKEATVTGKGSCGGIIGHANGGNGLVEMNTISVFSSTIKSTGTDTNKAGSIMGTVGSANVKVTNCSVIDNEVTSNNVANPKLWGRQGSSTGVLYVDDVQVEDFGAYTPSTTVTVTNDAELAKVIDVKDVTTIKLATGTYSDNIVLTVAAESEHQRDLKFEAVEGAEPVIASTVTLGYRNQGVGAAMWNGNVTFEGITFDHVESAKHSLDVQDVMSLTLKNCTIIGDGEYGLCSASGNGTGPSLIDNCTFENAAMQILGNFGTGLIIKECTFNQSRINVQAGNGVTVQKCTFNNTLKPVHVGDSFYCVRSNSTPITVKNTNINIDSELAEVAASQAKWYLLANRGTTNWTVENVAVTLSDAALMQTELDVTACTKTGVINTKNLTVNGKAYASTTEQLTAAVNNGATDIVLAGEFEMPSNGTTNAITFTSLNGTAIIDNTKGSYWENATLTFNNINFKTGTGMVNGNGADYAALYSKNVTYNSCTFTGPMRLGRDGAKFNACTFNGLGNDYVGTYGNSASFEGCTFNTEGKAILIYSDGPTVGTGAAPAVSVTNCTFNATQGAKAGAIANQNCAAVEIHNYGNGVTLTTSGNTVDEDFSGVWRIKTYENRFPDSKIFVNGTEYTTIALDGKTMTIDANRNVTIL